MIDSSVKLRVLLFVIAVSFVIKGREEDCFAQSGMNTAAKQSFSSRSCAIPGGIPRLEREYEQVSVAKVAAYSHTCLLIICLFFKS